MEVNALEIRNGLAEFAQVVEDHLATAPRYSFLAQARVLEECDKLALEVVDLELADVGLLHFEPGTNSGSQSTVQRIGSDAKVGSVPCRAQRGFVDLVGEEVEELARGFD